MNVEIVPDTKNPNFIQVWDSSYNFGLKIRGLSFPILDEWDYHVVSEKKLWVSPINPRVR